MSKSTNMVGPFVQKFFCDRLINQQDVSRRTISSYRDCFKLFLSYLEKHHRYPPERLSFDQLNADIVVAFLNYLESDRGNCVRTRNARLAALRSFFQFAALEVPEHLAVIHRILAIPMKRYDRPTVQYLSREEIESLVEAPDSITKSGRRDSVMFTTLYNTGARVSELIGLKRTDVVMTRGSASVTLHGKGRKNRTVPLWSSTARRLKEWLREIPDDPQAAIFPDLRGNHLSRSGFEYRLKRAAITAVSSCPSLYGRKISPHVFRHTTAMHLLQSGVDLSVIALWLGHESIQTTHTYMEADLRMKEAAIGKVAPVGGSPYRFKPGDKLIRFLESL